MIPSSDDRIVVCGAGGFIGGHLLAALLHQGHRRLRGVDQKPPGRWYQRFPEVENLTLDLSDRPSCVAAVRDAAAVYNLAADMGGMGFIESNKALCMLSVLINTHLLVAAREAGVERFFFSSSACVYAQDKQTDPAVDGLREADAYPAMPVYGPHGTYDGGREKAPAAICRKVALAKLSGGDGIEIWGSGGQTRSFTYIDDCIQGTLAIMGSDAITVPINLGSAEKVTINQLVDVVEAVAGTRLKRRYDLAAPKGVNGRNSDNTLIRERLGWEPSTPLRAGIERTYRWIYDEIKSGRSKDAAVNLG
jgi:GDP-D-mannose 3',5'-epimerase